MVESGNRCPARWKVVARLAGIEWPSATRDKAGFMNRAIKQLIEWKRGPFALLILLFVVSQLYLASVHNFPTTRYETDGIHYLERAAGALFQVDPYHGPGYSLAIRLVRWLTRLSPFSAAQLVSILAGILLLYSAYRVFSISDGHQIAFRAIVMTAFAPSVLKYSGMVSSDMFAAALMWVTLWILSRAERLDFRQLFAAGLVVGFAYLTKYVFIFLVIIPPLVLLLTQRRNRRALYALLGFYLGFCLLTAP